VNPERGFCRRPAEPQSEDEAATSLCQVHFPGERDITVARDMVAPAQLVVEPTSSPAFTSPASSTVSTTPPTAR
jgi:hypothetical protein